jgi:hypothetical protein
MARFLRSILAGALYLGLYGYSLNYPVAGMIGYLWLDRVSSDRVGWILFWETSFAASYLGWRVFSEIFAGWESMEGMLIAFLALDVAIFVPSAVFGHLRGPFHIGGCLNCIEGAVTMHTLLPVILAKALVLRDRYYVAWRRQPQWIGALHLDFIRQFAVSSFYVQDLRQKGKARGPGPG